jgi:hypothetical protein
VIFHFNIVNYFFQNITLPDNNKMATAEQVRIGTTRTGNALYRDVLEKLKKDYEEQKLVMSTEKSLNPKLIEGDAGYWATLDDASLLDPTKKGPINLLIGPKALSSQLTSRFADIRNKIVDFASKHLNGEQFKTFTVSATDIIAEVYKGTVNVVAAGGSLALIVGLPGLGALLAPVLTLLATLTTGAFDFVYSIARKLISKGTIFQDVRYPKSSVIKDSLDKFAKKIQSKEVVDGVTGYTMSYDQQNLAAGKGWSKMDIENMQKAGKIVAALTGQDYNEAEMGSLGYVTDEQKEIRSRVLTKAIKEGKTKAEAEELVKEAILENRLNGVKVPITGAGEDYEEMTGEHEYNAYMGAAEYYATGTFGGHTIVGGCDCQSRAYRQGGYEFYGAGELDLSTMEKYALAENSKVKEKIVADLVKALESIGFKSAGATPEEKIAEVLKVIPDGKTNKFKPEMHKVACERIVKSLNSVYGKIVDESLPEEVQCKHVYEILSSMKQGMYLEFLSVRGDVKKIIQNINVLRSLLSDIFSRMEEKVAKSKDDLLSNELVNLRSVHKMITEESERQLFMLNNILSLQLDPADASLAELIKADKNFSSTISRIEDKPGQDGFSRTLITVLNGMGMTANYAAIIERALKTVGLELSNYAKMSQSKTEFDKKMAELLIKRQFASDKDAHEFLTATRLLGSNLWRASEVKQVVGGAFGDEIDRSFNTKMDNRIHDQKKLKKLLLSSFEKQVAEQFGELIHSLRRLVPLVASSKLPMSNELTALRVEVGKISTEFISNKDIYYALTKFYADSLSQSKRDSLLSQLMNVRKYVKLLMDSPTNSGASAELGSVMSAVDSLAGLIDKYASEMSSRFGADEDVMVGGAGEDDDTPVFNNVYTNPHQIGDALKEFDFKIEIVRIRENVKRNAAELTHYAEDYEKRLGASVADRIGLVNEEHKLIERHINGLKTAGWFSTDNAGNADPALVKVADDGLKFNEMKFLSRKNFLQAVEAVDHYMKAFTEGLTSKPEDAKELKEMIASVEMLQSWYNKKSGDLIVHAFETPLADAPDNGAAVTVSNIKLANTHYYEDLAGVVAPVIGNIGLRVEPEKISTAVGHIREMMKLNGVLKNLISLFASFGPKFGGKVIFSETFMSPTKLFSCLTEWMVMSSFMSGDSLKDAAGAPLFAYDAANIINGQPPAVGINVNGVDVAIASAARLPDPAGGVLQRRHLARTVAGVFFRGVEPQRSGGPLMEEEDKLFAQVIKAIAGKVLAVIGTYDIFEDPMEDGSSHFLNHPVRQILGGGSYSGGGSGSGVSIDASNTELYFRLPLLANFYKDLFDFDGQGYEQYKDLRARGSSPINAKITFVPEVEGVFGPFVRLTFLQLKTRGLGYSESDIESIVSEINLIVQRIKDKVPAGSSVCEHVIDMFIEEINRRYGVVIKEDRDMFKNFRDERYNYSAGIRTDRYDEEPGYMPMYLPGEDKMPPSRKAPSESYLPAEFSTLDSTKKKNFQISLEHQRLMYRFKCLIDKKFDGTRPTSATTSFRNAIVSAENKIKSAQSDSEKLAALTTFMRGIDTSSQADQLKYLMLHETVVTGLNVLSMIHTLCVRAVGKIVSIDLNEIEDVLATSAVAVDGAANRADVFDVLNAAMKARYPYLEESIDLRPLATPLAGHATAGGGQMAQGLAYEANRVPLTNADHAALHGGAGTVAAVVAASRAYKAGQIPANSAAVGSLRYYFNRKYVASELIEFLLTFSNDFAGLVSVSIEAGKVQMSFGGLKKMVQELFSQVQSMMDQLSSYIKAADLAPLRDKLVTGSFYWLKEQLGEKIMEGRDTANKKYIAIDSLQERINDLMVNLTRRWNTGVNANFVIADIPGGQQDSLAEVFAEKVYYSRAKFNCGIEPSKSTPALLTDTNAGGNEVAAFADLTPQVMDFNGVEERIESLLWETQGTNKRLDLRYVTRRPLYTWSGDFNGNTSALFMFNQLTAKYMKQFFDAGSSKMYAPLIEPFAQGAFNEQVMDPTKCWPDMWPCYAISVKEEAVQLTGKIADKIEDEIRGKPRKEQLESQMRASLAYYREFEKIYKILNQTFGNKKTLLQFFVETGIVAAAYARLRDNANAKPSNGLAAILDGEGKSLTAARIAVSFDRIRASVSGFSDLVYDQMNNPGRGGVQARSAGLAASIRQFSTLVADYITPLFAGGPPSAPVINYISQKIGSLVNDKLSAGAVVGKLDLNSNKADIAAIAASLNAVWPDLGQAHVNFDQYQKIVSEIAAKDSLKTTTGVNLLKNIALTVLVREVAHANRGADIADANSVHGHFLSRFSEQLMPLGADAAARFNNSVSLGHGALINYFVAERDSFNLLIPVGANARITNVNFAVGAEIDTAIDPAPQAGGVQSFTDLNLAPLSAIITGLANANVPVFEAMKQYSTELSVAFNGPELLSRYLLKSTVNSVDSVLVKFMLIPMTGTWISDRDTKFTTLTEGLTKITGTAVKDILKYEDAVDINKNIFAFESTSAAKTQIKLARSGADPAETPTGVTNTFALIGDNVDYGEYNPNAFTINTHIKSAQLMPRLWDPKQGQVLFLSLGTIMRNMIRSKTASGAPVHLTKDITEVPIHLKERMRASLPAFERLYTGLIRRCVNLKKLIQSRVFDMTRVQPIAYHTVAGAFANVVASAPFYATATTGAGSNPLNNPWPGKLIEPINDNAVNVQRQTEILDSIIEGCKAFLVGIENVTRELADSGAVGEFSTGSSEDFKLSYGKYPLSPLSATLSIMNSDTRKSPVVSLGDSEFKMLFAVRGLLNSKIAPKLANMPGVMRILQQHNAASTAVDQISQERLDEFYSPLVHGFRFVHELRNVVGTIASYRAHGNVMITGAVSTQAFVRLPVIDMTGGPRTAASNKHAISLQKQSVGAALIPAGAAGAGRRPQSYIAKYAIESIAVTVSELEMMSTEDTLRRIVNTISNGIDNASPEIKNVIDIGKIPINVHAMMRDIPLANLYNYAWVFDQSVVRMLGVSEAFKDQICEGSSVQASNGSEALALQVIDPFFGTANEQTFINVRRVLLGDTAAGKLDRPKFLSDELYGKSLFGSVYSKNVVGETFDEFPALPAIDGLNQVYKLALVAGYPSKLARLVAVSLVKKLNTYANYAATIAGAGDLLTDVAGFDGSLAAALLLDFPNYQRDFTNRIAIDAAPYGGADGVNNKMFIMLKSIARARALNLAAAPVGETGANLHANADVAAYAAFDAFVNSPTNRGFTFNKMAIEAKERFFYFEPTYQPTALSILIEQYRVSVAAGAFNTGRSQDAAIAGKLFYQNAGTITEVTPNDAALTSIYTQSAFRMNTILIRNLILLTNVQRILRKKMESDLVQSRNLIHKGESIVDPALTEFRHNESSQPRPTGYRSERYM